MLKHLSILALLLAAATASYGQRPASSHTFKDSVTVRVRPAYDSVSGVHRLLFGENFRKEWAAPVKLPLIRISEVQGGLTPVKEGGGMQSKSLRLADKSGREWVIRSVEKAPEKLLPENLHGTFVVDWFDDAMSGQHPYAALIVPPIAEAAGVPHANPVIGVIAPDKALGEYGKIFAGMVVLLEEREPAGESDNTLKMLRDLNKNHDSRLDGQLMLRARLLDLLLGDWDRHEDQWRWVEKKINGEKVYTAVPRDRDQVFHVNNGLFPNLAAQPWIDPLLQGFDGDIASVKYSLYKTRFVQPYPGAQISFTTWMQIVNDFVKAETDEVLQAGLKRLPAEIYRIRHHELFRKLKQRRDNLPKAMADFYKFNYRIVDIRTSDKNDVVTITDAPDGAMHIAINKLDKSEKGNNSIMEMTYSPEFTEELRLYLAGGNDAVVINTNASPIKLQIIGGTGKKAYDVKASAKKVSIFDKKDSAAFTGKLNRVSKHLSNDTLNTAFVPVNPYNVWMPLATAAINADDGFLLGLGFKYTGKDGFRKLPYSNVQQLLITHSFATSAFRVRYSGEWIRAFGKADFTLQAYAQAPDNTMNFFGRGNETALIKQGNYRRYYRARFDTYQVDPALRWNTGSNSTLSVGPSFQFYHLNMDDNSGRFINQTKIINAYDSLILNKDKAHLGIALNYNSNQRDNNVLPTRGYNVSIKVQAYSGLNTYSRSFAQIRPEFTFYQKLNAQGSIVLSDRVGGGVGVGQPAFYQSMFLGGQGNLLGYLQYRFAGQHMVYNNLQARVKIADIANYILPGQLGLTGFYDAGRVWVSGENSDKWHQGTGGGFYFAPAGLTILQVLAGHSEEGWYPYISLNFRL
jgi:hypothetical protein